MATNITASMVKTLRERTQAGMMDCKKYLVKAEGDLELAEELMRKDGSKAEKKAGRTTAEGQVAIAKDGSRAVLLELNSETDFVSRGDEFTSLVNGLSAAALKANCQSAADLLAADVEGVDGATFVKNAITKLGENIQLRRVSAIDAGSDTLGMYLHGTKIGVLVHLKGGDSELAKDIAMHIAASRPQVIKPEEVPAELVAKEKEIYSAQALASGKPENIVEKMVEGRLRKFLDEISLYGQPFVKDPDQKIGKLVAGKQAEVVNFIRFEVGEGIEKEVMDFAKEVELAKGTS